MVKIKVVLLLFCREDKFLGQIGELGQIEKLIFVFLMYQMDFDFKEIVDVVICVILFYSGFRSYVEILSDFFFLKLWRIFCVYYWEKVVFEVY